LFSPQRFRTYSGTAHGKPEQIPKYGVPVRRAYSAAATMPPVPRVPKPPGTRIPSTPATLRSTSPCSRSPSSPSVKLAVHVALLEVLRLPPAPHHAHVVAEAAVAERLVEALVRVLEGDVF